MPSTFVNSRGVAHKGASSGVSIAFPDVCKTPAPPYYGPGIPVPLPNIAKTATAKQQTKVAGGLKPMTSGTFGGSEPGTLKGLASSTNKGNVEFVGAGSMNVKIEGKNVMAAMDPIRHNEAAQLRGTLDELHRQVRSLSPGNPDKWQAVLQSYAAALSALYVTITDDD